MRLLAIPLLAAILSLSSCVVSGKNSAGKTPATPAPPPATAAAKPPTPPPPISTPQTEIQLPPPQAVSEAALATIPSIREQLPAAEEPENPAKPPGNRKPPVNATAPKPEQPPATPAGETPAPVQGPPTPPTTLPPEDQPLLQPVYTEEQRRRLWGELEKRKANIEATLRSMNQARMPADQKSMVDRIKSFINQAEDMARRGDFTSAEALLVRAEILAKELSGGR